MEQGRHEHLLRLNGLYAHLYRLQFLHDETAPDEAPVSPPYDV